MTKHESLVSIITPVYNGEMYLSECIESVLAQTYENWEYTIVNNCSTDKSLEIAQNYAKRDNRIKVVNNENFVGVIENHNIAFRLISEHSKYCKVVSADDWIFPECISRLVDVAERNKSIGIVSSYALRGSDAEWKVTFDGLPYQNTVISGRDICRLTLLGKGYYFGSPTTVIYRSDLIRKTDSFYPNLTPNADVCAFYKYLQMTDFGFVHQVLSYERIHETQVSDNLRILGSYYSDKLRNYLEYGPTYLTQHEFEKHLKDVKQKYYTFLAVGVLHLRKMEFWKYHKKNLEELGYTLFCFDLVMAVFMKLIDLIFNPKQTLEKTFRRLMIF